MAYAQVRSILSRIQEIRRDLIATARTTADVEQDDYLRALLERAEQHDRRMEAYLAAHAEQAEAASLDTWVQYTEGLPAKSGPAALLEDDESETPYAERVEQALLEFDGQALRLYELIREQSRAETVRDFVDGLILMESQKARDKSRNYVETQDLRSTAPRS